MTQAQKNYVIKEINEKVAEFYKSRPYEPYESVRKRELFMKLLNSGKIKIANGAELKLKVINHINQSNDRINILDILTAAGKLYYDEQWANAEKDRRAGYSTFDTIYNELVVKSKTLVRTIMLETSAEAMKTLSDFDKTLESYKKRVTAL